MTKQSTRSITLIAILGAWALVLRFFDFPIFPPASFLKFDFSDLLTLIGLFIAGPKGLIAVALIRDGLNYLIKGGQMGVPIGAIMSFFGSLAIGYPLHLYWRKYKLDLSNQKLRQALVFSTLSLTLCLSLLNYFVALPFYVKVMNFPIDDYLIYVVTLIVPFNLLKGFILSLCVYFIYPKIRELLLSRYLFSQQYCN